VYIPREVGLLQIIGEIKEKEENPVLLNIQMTR
jgi:hypothetical protein